MVSHPLAFDCKSSIAATLPPVVIVGPAPPPYGGMALQAQALVERLTNDRAEVFFLPTNPAISPRLAGIKGVRTIIQSIIFIWNLCGHLTKARVVHLLGASYWYFALRVVPTVLLSKLFGRRVILNYRGGEAPRFFSRYGWFVLPVLHMVDDIAVPSAYLKRVFADHGFSVAVVPNFIDLERFRFRERTELKPRFLVNRSLEPLYNVRMAIDAYAIVKKKYPVARLDVVGGGSQAAELQSWVERTGIADVYFHGAVPNDKIPKYLEGADILLNPTNADNMPINLLEAFAAGVPVVTTNVGGIPDFVGTEDAALLVDAGDATAMAARMEELMTDAEKVASLTQRAKNLAAQMSWDRVGRLWLGIYAGDMAVRPGKSANAIN
jgi:glycosyltransferase involved in cell wall biosynthesis